MPTYRNISDRPVLISDMGIVVQEVDPGDEISTVFILDHYNELERISDEPYYNPINRIDELDIPVASSQTVDVDYRVVNLIVISGLTAPAKMYFNSVDNLPYLKLLPGDRVTIRNPKTIERIIIESLDEPVSLVVTQFYQPL